MSKEEKLKLKSDTKLLGMIILCAAFIWACMLLTKGVYYQTPMPEYVTKMIGSMFAGGIILILGRKFIVEAMAKLIDWWIKK